MNIYKISQTIDIGYDTYDSAIVVAETEEEARYIHPDKNCEDKNWFNSSNDSNHYWIWLNEWCHPKYVKVECIGTTFTQEKGVILASFNAG